MLEKEKKESNIFDSTKIWMASSGTTILGDHFLILSEILVHIDKKSRMVVMLYIPSI